MRPLIDASGTLGTLSDVYKNPRKLLVAEKGAKTTEITLQVPDRFGDEGPAELANRIKLYAALLMFKTKELSAGAAAELAGVDRFTFAVECQKVGIPLVYYPAEELQAELVNLRGKV